MTKYYIVNIGLAVIPFIVWKGMDMRTPKEILAFGIALALCLLSLYHGSLKRFKNYWLLILVGYFLVCMCMAPNFDQFLLAFKQGKRIDILFTRPIAGVWNFKPMLFALTYLIMLISIASYEYKAKWVKTHLEIMAMAGFLMAVYIFFQAAELDQFFSLRNMDPQVKHMTKPLLGGFIGQPTICAPFIVMCIPIAIYCRKYIFAVLMTIAVVMTQSKLAIGAIAVGVPLYLIVSSRKWHRRAGVVIILSFLIFCSFNAAKIVQTDWIKKAEGHSSGRILAWKNIIDDLRSPVNKHNAPNALTGFGPGAFEYTHSIRHENIWRQAHNEPLEFLYNFGFVGIWLLFMSFLYIARCIFYAIIAKNETFIALTGSLFCILLCSLGTFPFHIAPTMFYTVVILGLMHNDHIIRGDYV